MGDMNFKAILSNSQPQVEVMTSEADKVTGYRSFRIGGFEFQRDEYFARISWPAKDTRISHLMPVDAFLRAIMRDVAWGFFYGLFERLLHFPFGAGFIQTWLGL